MDSAMWNYEKYCVGDKIEVVETETKQVINAGRITSIEMHKDFPCFHFQSDGGACFVAPYLTQISVRKPMRFISCATAHRYINIFGGCIAHLTLVTKNGVYDTLRNRHGSRIAVIAN